MLQGRLTQWKTGSTVKLARGHSLLKQQTAARQMAPASDTGAEGTFRMRKRGFRAAGERLSIPPKREAAMSRTAKTCWAVVIVIVGTFLIPAGALAARGDSFQAGTWKAPYTGYCRDELTYTRNKQPQWVYRCHWARCPHPVPYPVSSSVPPAVTVPAVTVSLCAMLTPSGSPRVLLKTHIGWRASTPFSERICGRSWLP
jgi:hypothetical protein